MTTFLSQLLHIVRSNIEGTIILVALLLVPFIWKLATTSGSAASRLYPYIRGSELYYRSLANRDFCPSRTPGGGIASVP